MKLELVNQVTEGAACTAMLSQEHIDNDDQMLKANSDHFFEWDADKF